MSLYFCMKEDRARDLMARIKRVKKVAGDIVMSPEWDEPGVPKEWSRAIEIKRKLEKELGNIAGYCLAWRDDK